MVPHYAAKSLGLLFALVAVVCALGAFVQIDPLWIWGPYEPWRGVSPATWCAALFRQAVSLLESRDCSSARSTLSSSSSRLIGFSMKSDAPAFMACTAMGTSLFPVIMMAGSRWPAPLSRISNSNPSIPGR